MKQLLICTIGRPETLALLNGLGKQCLGCGQEIKSKWDYVFVWGYLGNVCWYGEFCNDNCFDLFRANHHERDLFITISSGHSE